MLSIFKNPILTSSLFIIGWWAWAFYPSTSCDSTVLLTPPPQKNQEIIHLETLISSLNRNEILQALCGDLFMMKELVDRWDLDAHLLKRHGYRFIQCIEDDMRYDIHFSLRNSLHGHKKKSNPSYLPQTEVAASLLLTLIDPEKILAIPERMRKLCHIYPKHKMERISLNTNQLSQEKLQQLQPKICFVAKYSHPLFIQKLKHLKIPYAHVDHIQSIEAIQNTIHHMGALVGVQDRANALQTFMKAFFIHIENRIQALKQGTHSSLKNVLLLNYYMHFSTPSPNTLCAQLLEKMHIKNLAKNLTNPSALTQWRLSLEKEDIVKLNPDYILISTPYPQKALEHMRQHPAFSKLNAFRKGLIFCLDDNIQENPSHYIILAYLDLYQAVYEHTSLSQNHRST